MSFVKLGGVAKESPAVTALLTLSTISLCSSRNSVSSRRCFFPATGSEGPAGLEGSMPSFRSKASSFALCASCCAFFRAGSLSIYSASLFGMTVSPPRRMIEVTNVLLGLFDRAKPASTQVPARVVVTRLLATHPTAGRTKLRAETSLSTTDPGNKAKGYEISMTFAQKT